MAAEQAKTIQEKDIHELIRDAKPGNEELMEAADRVRQAIYLIYSKDQAAREYRYVAGPREMDRLHATTFWALQEIEIIDRSLAHSLRWKD